MSLIKTRKFVSLFIALVFMLNTSALAITGAIFSHHEQALEKTLGEKITICTAGGEESISFHDFMALLDAIKNSGEGSKYNYKQNADKIFTPQIAEVSHKLLSADLKFQIASDDKFASSDINSIKSRAPPTVTM